VEALACLTDCTESMTCRYCKRLANVENRWRGFCGFGRVVELGGYCGLFEKRGRNLL